jgi:hypothetical protein
MSGERRFGSSMFGFNKYDVTSYIEKMLKEFDEKLKEKDDEVSSLKNQLKNLKALNDEYAKKTGETEEGKSKIADVLIRAKETAEIMLEEARNQAFEEKKKLEGMVEDEREKLVSIKQDIKNLKSEVIDTLKKYEQELEIISNQ